MRIIWCTDIHLADRPPRGRIDDYTASIFEKLRQVAHAAAKLKAKAVLMGGDIFHIKAPIRNSHLLVGRTIEAFRAFPCPVYSILGNHDVLFAERDSYQKQPIGVLESAGAIRLIDSERGNFVVLEEDGVRVRVEGVPYDVDFAPRRLAAVKRDGEDWLLTILHILASKKPGSLGTERIFGYDELAQAAPADVFLLGHYHINQGVTRLEVANQSRWFVNIGSISRGSLAYEDVSRTPSFCLLDFPPRKDAPPKFTVVRLKVPEAKLSFRIEEHKGEKAIEADVAEFVETVGRELDAGVDLDLGTVLDRLDVDMAVKETVKKYLEMV